jgi:hypothetical protein
MRPYAWFVLGGLSASVFWMFLVAMVYDQVERYRRDLAWTESALEQSGALVRETLAQSTRMAQLAVDAEVR